MQDYAHVLGCGTATTTQRAVSGVAEAHALQDGAEAVRQPRQVRGPSNARTRMLHTAMILPMGRHLAAGAGVSVAPYLPPALGQQGRKLGSSS